MKDGNRHLSKIADSFFNYGRGVVSVVNRMKIRNF